MGTVAGLDKLVSVVMASYNGSKTISLAIESIASQTYTNWELIVVDDTSTDDTLSIVKGFESKINIKIIQNKVNLGLARSLNRGIAAASGDYIARMDDDDVSRPERFEKQIEFLQNNLDVDVLGTGVFLVDASFQGIGEQNRPEHDSEIKDALCKYNPICHPTVMMRRSFVERFGGYDEALRWKEDYELWGRAASSSKYHNLQEPLLDYRVKKSKTLKAVPTSVRIRVQNGMLRGCFLKSLYWAVLYVLSSVARKFGYTQKAHRRVGRKRTISGW